MQESQRRVPDESGGSGPESATDVTAQVDELISKPVDADGVQALTLGTIAWAVAGIVLLLFFRPQLAAHDASWWLWVCLVGALLGLVALPYVLRRRAVYQRAAATDRGDS